MSTVYHIGPAAWTDHFYLNPNEANENGFTRLMLAALNGDKELIKQLLASDAQVDSTDSSGRTALFWAVHGGKQKAVEILLRAGADPNHEDQQGVTPSDLAQNGEDHVIVALIIQAQVLAHF